MQLTVEEHENLNNAYKDLDKVRNAILDRSLAERKDSAYSLRIKQESDVNVYFQRKKLNIAGIIYSSPKTSGLGEIVGV